MMQSKLQKPGTRAWLTALLLAVGVLVNYFDRVNLAVAFSALKAEWHITDRGFGILSGLYSWTYTLMQFPVGGILDAFGVRLTGSIAAALWSVASFGAAWAPGLRTFVAARLTLGVAEAPTFPANAKAIAEWFPPEKRGLPTGMFDSAAKLGSAIGVPLLGLLLARHGWRWSFAFTGVLSAAYFLLFVLFYRDPKKQSGRAMKSHSAARPKTSYRTLLRNRKVIGLTLGFAGYGYSFYLFLTWLPEFLGRSLHLDLLHSAVATAVPWGCAAASSLVIGGGLVDALIRRGFDASRVRKTVLITGMALGLASFLATQTQSEPWAIAWLTIALSGLAASASVGWQIPSLIAPTGADARVGAIMNFGNNAMAIAAPAATGFLLAALHSFVWPMAAAAAMVALGIASYIFLLGRIEPANT